MSRLAGLALIAACALSLATAPAVAESGKAARRTLLAQVNAFRAEHDLPPVRMSSDLARGAQLWAREIARSGRIRHGNLRAHLRSYDYVGEVLEWHPGDAQPAVTIQAWRTSRPHRRALLNRRYSRIGMGLARGRIRGKLCTIWVARLGG